MTEQHSTYEELCLAIQAEDQRLVKKIIAEHPEIIEYQDRLGFTVFHLAALIHAPELVRFFLDQKPSMVNVKDVKGLTPLHLVRDPEVAKVYIEYGAKINAVDNRGNTPLHIHAEYQLPAVPASSRTK